MKNIFDVLIIVVQYIYKLSIKSFPNKFPLYYNGYGLRIMKESVLHLNDALSPLRAIKILSNPSSLLIEGCFEFINRRFPCVADVKAVYCVVPLVVVVVLFVAGLVRLAPRQA